MPKHALREVFKAVMGIMQLSTLINGHCIDGEVSSEQILLKPHAGVGLKLKAMVANAGLSLCSGKCVLCLRLGVEEDWKVPPNGPETSQDHGLWCGPHHQKIMV